MKAKKIEFCNFILFGDLVVIFWKTLNKVWQMMRWCIWKKQSL